ncbi:hypothetical protein LOZ12_005867 [Ophidiomyces ophidiicola]|nr:hypothetical protein LOZ64_005209 [Ophidiomyces ophidiicola]KAI1933522.1 hypothetical protein LOZ62_006447 [Ophidiomyces ophidiicola]KAI2000265.1 hypothetical protein LOZ50_006075 [Ophidiomyces ophidiicola]KAI2004169.1 hypothetical protein LOZ49_005975 [Ophidiomyces ophidiicola]KAI2010266.1 hypothetical protein LOZ46_006337 [Ophidiomyces ophidiicola]
MDLWCWISDPWGILRLSVYFGPIWLAFIITFSIYIAAGIKIYRLERGLRRLTAYSQPALDATEFHSSDGQPSRDWQINTSQTNSVNHVANMSREQQPGEIQPARQQSQSSPSQTSSIVSAYCLSSAAEGEPGPSRQMVTREPSEAASQQENIEEDFEDPGPLPEEAEMRRSDTVGTITDLERQSSGQGTGAEKTVTRRTFSEGNAAAAYTKLASLYFLSLLVTWVPATTNRIYIFIHPRPNYALLFASGTGVALQGFWNGIIFFTTSWQETKVCSKIIISPHGKEEPSLGCHQHHEGQKFDGLLKSDTALQLLLISRPPKPINIRGLNDPPFQSCNQ